MKAPLLLVSLFTATDALPGKVGLITEWTQQQKGTSSDGSTTAETYAYSYDKAGRLTGSLRYAGTLLSGVNTLTERNITYDRSGNLLTLDRYGDSSGATPTESLSYTYTGPKRNTWTYDAHGNVTADPQAGLSIEWNAIGLPRTITASSGTNTASTQRSYLADGSLAQVSDGTTIRLYLGDMVFNKASNGTVTFESAGWEGGRLLPGIGADKVLYVVKDHLGSVRVVKDGTGAVRQRYDYYPYGTVSRTWTSSATTDYSEKRYRFGGKEVAGSSLTDLPGAGAAPGAPYLDFGARLYTPGAAMWLSVDPLMEKYYAIGPNVYCAGNPVNVVDPEGEKWYLVNSNGEITLINPIEEEFDRLFLEQPNVKNPDSSEGIRVYDMSILCSLEGNKKGVATGVASKNEDLASLFYFLADNTDVEWVLFGYDSGTTFLGTKRMKGTSGYYWEYGIKNPNTKIHSHPLTESDLHSEWESMGKSWNAKKKEFELLVPSDINNVIIDRKKNGEKATKSYVYFPKTKHTYVLTPDPKRF